MTLKKSVLLESYRTGVNAWFDTLYKLKCDKVEASKLYLGENGDLIHMAEPEDIDVKIEEAQQEANKMLRIYYELKDCPEEIDDKKWQEIVEEIL